MAVPEWRRVLGGGADPAPARQPGATAQRQSSPAAPGASPTPSPEQVAGIPQVGVDINGVTGNRGLGGELPQVNK